VDGRRQFRSTPALQVCGRRYAVPVRISNHPADHVQLYMANRATRHGTGTSTTRHGTAGHGTMRHDSLVVPCLIVPLCQGHGLGMALWPLNRVVPCRQARWPAVPVPALARRARPRQAAADAHRDRSQCAVVAPRRRSH
jgi:hypothetical protein